MKLDKSITTAVDLLKVATRGAPLVRTGVNPPVSN